MNKNEYEGEENNLLLLILPWRYKLLVSQFYKNGGKKRVEIYAKNVESENKLKLRAMRWGDESGLKNISLSPSCGLDLSELEHRFVFHNIYDVETMKPLYQIAKYYIDELEAIKNNGK